MLLRWQTLRVFAIQTLLCTPSSCFLRSSINWKTFVGIQDPILMYLRQSSTKCLCSNRLELQQRYSAMRLQVMSKAFLEHIRLKAAWFTVSLLYRMHRLIQEESHRFRGAVNSIFR